MLFFTYLAADITSKYCRGAVASDWATNYPQGHANEQLLPHTENIRSLPAVRLSDGIC